MASYDLGPYRPRPLGEYNPATEYRYLDIVKYNGGAYICCNVDTIDGISCIGILPEGEASSELYWMCIGSKGDKGDSPNVYSPYGTVTNGIWNYTESDKIFIPTDAGKNTIQIDNVYNGACGIIITRKELELPSNSMKSIDYNFVELSTGADYYFYTFTYTTIGGTDPVFIWHRSVITRS